MLQSGISMQSACCSAVRHASAARTLAHWSLDVAHDKAVLVIQELDTDLSHLHPPHIHTTYNT